MIATFVAASFVSLLGAASPDTAPTAIPVPRVPFFTPTPSALPLVDVKSLSSGLKATLPDTQAVSLSGIRTTLGALRAAHAARLLSIQAAIAKVGTSVMTFASSAPGHVLTNNDSHAANYAADYKAYCGQANVTVCGYLPADGIITKVPFGNQHYLILVDPLMTDTTLCRGGGGVPGDLGCTYQYPDVSIAQFAPSPSLTITTPHCDTSAFTTNNDPRGAVAVTAIGSTIGPLPAPLSCTIRVVSP
jgi:hypothetical protein